MTKCVKCEQEIMNGDCGCPPGIPLLEQLMPPSLPSQGWQCPRCQRIWAPFVRVCETCMPISPTLEFKTGYTAPPNTC